MTQQAMDDSCAGANLVAARAVDGTRLGDRLDVNRQWGTAVFDAWLSDLLGHRYRLRIEALGKVKDNG